MVVADGVLGTVHRQKALALGAADLVVAAAHLVGNKAVGIAVDEEDRHFAVGRGIGAVGILRVKMAEQDGPQPPAGVGGATTPGTGLSGHAATLARKSPSF